MSSRVIYLDYNATTPVAPEVLEEMLPWFSQQFWNAASAHGPGGTAAEAVDSARARIARTISVRPSEIIFTSGATEANNLALKGVMRSAPRTRNRILIGATEHKAVLDTAEFLRSQGFELQIIPVDPTGAVGLGQLLPLLDQRTALVSVMAANNETGALAPIEQLASATHEVGAVFHTDATQALGRIPLDLVALGVDLASFSAHKLYGPKGVGGLFVNRKVHLEAQLHGGGHERGFRSGTLNVPGIVGFGAAAQFAESRLATESLRQEKLIGRFLHGFSSETDALRVVTGQGPRLPNTVNIRVTGADAEAVMANATSVAISSGSACTSLAPTPSHVLTAMGLSSDEAYECLRISVGSPTTEAQIDQAVIQLLGAIARVRDYAEAVPA